jgi:hypothetical protein
LIIGIPFPWLSGLSAPAYPGPVRPSKGLDD